MINYIIGIGAAAVVVAAIVRGIIRVRRGEPGGCGCGCGGCPSASCCSSNSDRDGSDY